MRNLRALDAHRVDTTRSHGWSGDETCGAFALPSPSDGQPLRVIASSGIEWEPIVGYEGLYEVSNDGRVRALAKQVPVPNGGMRNHDLMELSTTEEHGYPRVTLCRGGNRTKPLVHVLVARAFIPNPRGFPEINHKDFDKRNARVTNLEWCTPEYNHHHAVEAGKKNGLTVAVIERIRDQLAQGMDVREIAGNLDLRNEAVNNVRKGWVRNTTPDEPTGFPGDPFWDHVSVSRSSRCPNWPEMEFVKRKFFEDHETAMQLHVPIDQHINAHPRCLHLFRPQHVEIPRPPGWMVGPVERSGDAWRVP